MTEYVTRDGDILDQICHEFYGSAGKYIELVLESNPRLSEKGPVFPSGVLIKLPDKNLIENTSSIIRLWN